MLRKNYKILLLFSALFLFLFLLPQGFVQKVRFGMIHIFSPLWGKNKEGATVEKLETENHLLRVEIGKLRTLIEEKGQIAKLQKQTDLLPAFVIYRDPALWMSAFWVDVGTVDNEQLGREIVSHNSPVVIGNAVVGVIDHVGKRQSRVRLITDMRLKPSVRVARGLPQNATFVGHIDSVLMRIKEPKVVAYLEGVRKSLEADTRCWYLAKGVICGSGCSLWRDRTKSLKGYGFNDAGEDPLPIMENDLLVTTGMDGVFPVGLSVAEVTKVYPLREGAYSYDIEATPVVKNLDSLQMVFIMPKMGFEDL